MTRFDETHRANLRASTTNHFARLRAERLEDVLWLTETGESLTGAAT